MLIYLVEDDNSIRELVAYTLHSARRSIALARFP